jgi:hypothetical protein
MPALPANVGYGYVKARFLLAYTDGADVDTDADAVPATGLVTFTPSAKYIKNTGSTPDPTIIVPSKIVCPVDGDGYLIQPTVGGKLVQLVATDDPDLNPSNWTWNVTFNLIDTTTNKALELPGFSFELPVGQTVDLAAVSPMPTSNGTFYIAGPPISLSVGTVTTGSAGSSASVTQSGTAAAPVLNFTIPRGDTGATGSLAGLTASAPITYSSNTVGLADVSPSPAGTYGSSTLIPAITVDAKGRVTSVTTNAASGGGAWSTYTPTLTGITLGSGTNMAAKFTQIGKTVHFRVHFSVGTAANALTINVGATVGLPVGSVHNSAVTGFSLANLLFVGANSSGNVTAIASSPINASSVTILRNIKPSNNDHIITDSFYDGFPVNFATAQSVIGGRYLAISGT